MKALQLTRNGPPGEVLADVGQARRSAGRSIVLIAPGQA
jgi:hypothetical protein